MPADPAPRSSSQPQQSKWFAGIFLRQNPSRTSQRIQKLQQHNAQLKKQLTTLQQRQRQQSRAERTNQQLQRQNVQLKKQLTSLQQQQQQQSRYYRAQQYQAEQAIEQLQHYNTQLKQHIQRLQNHNPLPRYAIGPTHSRHSPADRPTPSPHPVYPRSRPPEDKRRSSLQKRSTRSARVDRLINATIVTLVAVVFGWAVLYRSLQSSESQQDTSTQPSPSVAAESFAADPASPDALDQRAYNMTTAPTFHSNDALQAIVQDLVDLAVARDLPTDALSITLIDVNSLQSGSYQQEQLRFPASIIKLFWMVVLYDQIQSGIWPGEDLFAANLEQMIQKSSNDAASYILDQITNTSSGPELNEAALAAWKQRREQLNWFFQTAGYDEININQKIFRIVSLDLNEPQGRDLQIRGNPNMPLRNQISTQQAARLMYEIATEQAVSETYSRRMARWLSRDLRVPVEQQISPNSGEFNPIRAFLGESLPPDVKLLSKAGWTSTTRQEAAYISTSDESTAYILVIFGEDPAYSRDEDIFPIFSRRVFERMVAQNDR